MPLFPHLQGDLGGVGVERMRRDVQRMAEAAPEGWAFVGGLVAAIDAYVRQKEREMPQVFTF